MADDAGRTALHMLDTSDVDHINGAEKDSDKKSSGLKCIAKQVIDIMKTNAYMSYQQVAHIVVQLNLKMPGLGGHDSEGLCSQS